eukprot:CAMPEP_0201577144 /NCGR_PEP_ID=MMETSP0190_2-20130828/23380_1 /ASSEMBLY_ACC=CAM_ASM_000263 /TAXON_ID=37353 /ORGANISM="Rosalina sp." /LENGTH=384 /DNA_ID=CAMNT_0048008863 /DNA_START=139 /DNA_END=1293 /DNA_ORIENTATION=+
MNSNQNQNQNPLAHKGYNHNEVLDETNIQNMDNGQWVGSHKTELSSLTATNAIASPINTPIMTPTVQSFYNGNGHASDSQSGSEEFTNSESGFGTTPTSRFNSSFNTHPSRQFDATTFRTFKYDHAIKNQQLKEGKMEDETENEDEKKQFEDNNHTHKLPQIVVFKAIDSGLGDTRINTHNQGHHLNHIKAVSASAHSPTPASEDDMKTVDSTISALSGVNNKIPIANKAHLSISAMSDITQLTDISGNSYTPIPDNIEDMMQRKNTMETMKVNEDKSTYGIRTPPRSLLSIDDIYNGRSNTRSRTTNNTQSPQSILSSHNTMVSSSVFTSATTDITGNDSLDLNDTVEISRNTESITYEEYGKHDNMNGNDNGNDSTEFDLYI